MAKVIDGELFKSMMMEGACAIEDRKLEANELNVFPVPDGDTGTNMSLTMACAYKAMKDLSGVPVGQAAETAASALLRGARGNSGVILSLLFRGFSQKLKGLAVCTGTQLADALASGVVTAYNAVMKPVEGTILTVSRMAAERAKETAMAGGDTEAVLAEAIERGKEALAETPSQNPVLCKAGVVDAGGFGFIVILEGMYAAMTGAAAPRSLPVTANGTGSMVFTKYETADIVFTYCTEFIVQRKNGRRSMNKLRAFLQNIGDSVVLVDDDQLIKVHVHTNQPDRVLGEGLKFGQLLSVKIENMREQHTELISEEDFAPKEAAAPEKKYGFVAVAAGAGVSSVFRDLGVDRIVNGGQTMNPATEDILAAVEQTPAEVVFVLPNNKNIIMAAEQAARLCAGKEIVVIPSRTIPQGVTAMLSFSETQETEENRAAMTEALTRVLTGQLTYAVRDSEFDGKWIKAGDFISLLDNKLHAHGKNKAAVLRKLAKDMTKNGASFITVYYGEGVAEEDAQAAGEIFLKEAKDAEVNVISGGHPVYYYIISVE